MHLESNTFCPHGGPLQFGEATLDHASPKRSGRNTAATVVHPKARNGPVWTMNTCIKRREEVRALPLHSRES